MTPCGSGGESLPACSGCRQKPCFFDAPPDIKTLDKHSCPIYNRQNVEVQILNLFSFIRFILINSFGIIFTKAENCVARKLLLGAAG